MKHVKEFRQPAVVQSLVGEVRRLASRRWSLMEVCGGQTHSIVRHGLQELLAEEIQFLHGPGCPVCVTPTRQIDEAIVLSLLPGVTLCSYGDMLRVPGSCRSLLQARGEGGQVELVHSPLEVLRRAKEQPERHFVFFGVGFETTAPATAMALKIARGQGMENFSVLTAHVVVPPALDRLLSERPRGVDALLAPGHVCSVVGLEDYEHAAQRFELPVVVTGFEPVDLLRGVLQCVRQLEVGSRELCNQYERAVGPTGNAAALGVMREVFESSDRQWRGIGMIAGGGLALRESYVSLDAQRRFEKPLRRHFETSDAQATGGGAGNCIAGQVLLGQRRPPQCPSFGKGCTPERPLGAPMVSSEGACAAYYRYVPSVLPATSPRAEGHPA